MPFSTTSNIKNNFLNSQLLRRYLAFNNLINKQETILPLSSVLTFDNYLNTFNNGQSFLSQSNNPLQIIYQQLTPFDRQVILMQLKNKFNNDQFNNIPLNNLINLNKL